MQVGIGAGHAGVQVGIAFEVVALDDEMVSGMQVCTLDDEMVSGKQVCKSPPVPGMHC